jgi:hypothetical protein
MAIYKIFPIQDTTMYSLFQTTNAGSDEILEVGSMNNKSGVFSPELVLSQLGVDDIRRSLLLFDTNEISSAIALAETASNVSSSLRMFLAEATNLTQEYKIEAWPVDGFWSNGTGKFIDSPTNTGGTSWKYRSAESNNVLWGATTASYYKTPGGGKWIDNNIYSASQTFNYTSNKDVNMGVTNIVTRWMNSGQNYGFIVKLPFTGAVVNGDVFEANPQSYINLKFFSMNTHTIYPPCLEFKWSDYNFETSSNYPYTTAPSSSIAYTYSASFSSSVSASVTVWATSSFTSSFTTNYSQSVITSDTYILVSNNNLGEYENDSVYKFRFKARDQFPTRQFTTSSIYLNWKYLPSHSYYAIQDYKTKEMAIDFDTKATQLSIDPSGSFFKLYMNGLQPERSYKILIKSTLETGETIVKDNDIIFKVIR